MSALLLSIIYLVFISLGLPDSLLGSGWPSMQAYFDVPSSYAGYVAMTISFMTIVSALLSPHIIQKLSTQWIIVLSILLTVLGLLGFSLCRHFWMLFLCAIPFGLGAGSIDAAVNHYVANHYSFSVMNFLHCFFGVGAMISPYIMAYALSVARWNEGYLWTAYIQIGILMVCILSFPLWRNNETTDNKKTHSNAGIKTALRIPGVFLTLVAFFSYCSGEAICFLWTPSYFAGTRPTLSDETIASFGSLVVGGLMLGRLVSGFISNKLNDRALIRVGIIVELIGILLVLLPIQDYIAAAIGFVAIGIGLGPIYPAIQHMAPSNFGKHNSAAVISLQTAAAYIGSTFMPVLFGNLQQIFGISIMPFFLLIFALLNMSMLEIAYRKIASTK